MERSILYTCLFITLVAFGWMSTSRQSAGQLPPQGEKSAPPRARVDIGDSWRDFTLENQDGERTECSKLIDGRKSLLYFYSGCCGHCSDQLPVLSRMAKRLIDENIAIVGVEYLGDSKSCSGNKSEFDLVGTIFADPDGATCRTFGVGDFTVFTVDRGGVVRYRGRPDNGRAIEESLGLPGRP